MKYYSEMLKKTYDTEAECLKAEAEETAKKTKKEERKKETDEAVRKAVDLIAAYNRDYKEGYSITIGDEEVEMGDDILKAFSKSPDPLSVILKLFDV